MATDQHLRDLLRAGRATSGHLTQGQAASLAGISEVYWQKIESGSQAQAPAQRLAVMLHAIGISADAIPQDGYKPVADWLRQLESTDRQPQPSPEEHLAATPGATPEEISALQAIWRALRAERTIEPADDLSQRRRRNKD